VIECRAAPCKAAGYTRRLDQQQRVAADWSWKIPAGLVQSSIHHLRFGFWSPTGVGYPAATLESCRRNKVHMVSRLRRLCGNCSSILIIKGRRLTKRRFHLGLAEYYDGPDARSYPDTADATNDTENGSRHAKPVGFKLLHFY